MRFSILTVGAARSPALLLVNEAVRYAVRFTHLGIQTASPVGKGVGPLNDFHSLVPRVDPLPSQANKFPLTKMLIEGSATAWSAYVQHDFVNLLGNGGLPRESFSHFIIQGYLYLKYYVRAYGEIYQF